MLKNKATSLHPSKCLTDIFFIALHFALQFDTPEVLFDTGMQLLNLKDHATMYTQPYCTACHTFTKCDITSAFRGIGKVKPIRLLQKMPRYQASFASLCESWEVSEKLIDTIEVVTCAMYGKPRLKSVDKLRAQMLVAKCGKDDEQIAPTRTVDGKSVNMQKMFDSTNQTLIIWFPYGKQQMSQHQ